MKTRNRFSTLNAMLALVAVLGIAGVASAQGHTPSPQEHGANMGATGGHMQGLTPEKQAAAQKLHADHNAATAQLKQQLFAKQSELNAQLYGGATDDKKVQALTKEIGDLNTRLLEAQVTLKRQLAKEGIPAMGGMGMGMGGCGMMSGGMGMHHGM
jgi:zinc resistance-associated protein